MHSRKVTTIQCDSCAKVASDRCKNEVVGKASREKNVFSHFLVAKRQFDRFSTWLSAVSLSTGVDRIPIRLRLSSFYVIIMD